MKKIVIHRGGILSAGYDASRRWLEVEFETHRIMRVEGIGFEMANRFLHSDMPAHYWEEEIEEISGFMKSLPKTPYLVKRKNVLLQAVKDSKNSSVTSEIPLTPCSFAKDLIFL